MTPRNYSVEKNLHLVCWPVRPEDAAPPRPPPGVHHVVVVDCSGSMSADLPSLRVALKAKIPALVRERDTVTLIWFSGRGEVGVVLEGETVATLRDLARVTAAIDQGFRPVGLTGFREPLQAVIQSIYRLKRTASLPISLFFMSDGIDNQWTKAEIFEPLTELARLVTTSTLVEYGDYADRAMLAAMASQLGGTLLRAESLDEYEPMLEQAMGPIRDGEKIEIRIQPGTDGIIGDIVFELRDDGAIVTYKPSCEHVIVGDSTREIWYLTTSPLPNAQIARACDGALTQAYAAASLFVTRGNGNVVWPLLREIGDALFIRRYAQCFGKQSHGVLADQLRAAAHDPGLCFLEGIDPYLVPPSDAFCVVDLLRMLEQDEEARVLVDHPSFKYRRVTRRRVDADENFSERDKDRIRALQVEMASAKIPANIDAIRGELEALIAKKQPALKFKENPAPDGYEVHGIVYNEEQPNISLRVRRTGTVYLGDRLDRDRAGGVPALAGLGGSRIERHFPTFTFRNYAIVSHGNVNVRHLPLRVGIDTWQVLRAEGTRSQPLVIQEDPKEFGREGKGTIVVDLSVLPIMNRAMVELASLEQTVRRACDLARARAQTKIYKSVIATEYPAERARDDAGYLSLYGREATAWLAEQGLTEHGGFAPKRVQATSTDYIMGKSLKIKLKGYSTLPPVDKLREKVVKGSKLNGPESLMAEALLEIENFKRSHPKAQHQAWVAAREKMLIAESRALSFDLSQVALAVIVGQVWFSDCTDLDDRTREVQSALAPTKIQGTAHLEEIRIDL